MATHSSPGPTLLISIFSRYSTLTVLYVVEYRLFETIRCVCRKRQREQEIAEEEAAKKKKEWEKQWDVRIINCIFLIS